MTNRTTIGKKLMTAFGLVLIVAGLSAAASLFSIRSLNARFDTAVAKTVRKIQLGAELNNIKSDMYVAQRGFVLATLMKDESRAESQRAAFDSLVAKMNARLEEIHPLISVPAGRRFLTVFENDLSTWLREYPTVVQLCRSGHPDSAQQYSFEKIAPVYSDMSETGDRFVEVYRNVLEADKRAAAAEYSQALWISLLSFGVLGILAVASIITIRRLTGNLQRAAAELYRGAEQVASAAGQLSSSSQSLAQGASEQAASLEETSATSEEINSMASSNTGNSRAAAELMTQSQQEFGRAGESLAQMVSAMGDIKSSSDKISRIIKTIDEIAFQTNILALNAAVEAARAGEAGMGFAVVADEVRSLAQRSAQAAKDTTDLIEDSIAKSNDGKSRLDQLAAVIQTVTGQAAKMRALVDEVNLGSHEQARGIEQVSKTIAQMEQVTQKTAANAEESASSAEELTVQSGTLRQIAERLTALVGTAS